MVEKRRNILTHVILWILIPIILFPIVWVVSTSIRRDEAAFSTKLFSSRITLQNYRDLLFPEKNMPVLSQEIQNLILRTPPYDDWKKDRLEKEIDNDIKSLKNYLKETQERYENAKNSFDKVNSILSSKNDEIKDKTISILKELKSYLEKVTPKEGTNQEDFKVVLYKFLYKESYNSKIFNYLKEDVEKVLGYKINSCEDYKLALFELEKAYNNSLGKLELRLPEINKKLEANIRKYNSVRERYREIQDEIIFIYRILNEEIKLEIASILKDLNLAANKDSLKISLVSFRKSSNNSFIFKSIKTLDSIIERLNKYPDFYEFTNNLKEVSHILKNNGDSLGNLSSIYAAIEKLNRKIFPVLSKLQKNIDLIQKEEIKLASIKQENEFLEMQKELLQNEVNQEEENLKPATKTEQIQLLIKKIDEKIKHIENITGFKKLVNYCAPIESELRDFATTYIINFGRDDLVAKIESAADKLKWFSDYSTFLEKFYVFSRNLNSTIEKSSSLVMNLEKSWRDLFNSYLNNERISLKNLDDLYNIIKTDYVNLVSSNMNVVSKKAGDLMDIIPYKEVRRDLNRIDGELFRIDQIWKQKTKHYFLIWVRNSILVAGTAAIITTLICSLAAYPFSRMRFFGRKYGILALLLIQMFPSAVYMIAIYTLLNLLGKFIPLLGLDTLTGLTFVYLGNIAYNMYLIKGYYDTIPDSLEESAMIDGATRFQTFYKIVVPLARPILTVVVILTFMNVFNEFIFARIILQDAKNYTYAIGLWTFSSGPYLTEWGLFTSAALLGMLPMTILFLSLQKYIVSGLTKGAVKG